MRTIFLVAAFIGTALAITTETKAQYYPWCASYTWNGRENCGFVSFEQCLATISGIGGHCQTNPWYDARGAGARGDTRPRAKKQRYR
jgi:Protein of unknown function (DUF3551)